MKNNALADKFRNEGNALYRHQKFYEALISYNKSLCHAMPQSSQLGLAYANRSAVYFELKQFDKCLNNIQLARINKYPNEAKMKDREKKCNEQLKTQQPDPKNDPWTYFKLSYPANGKIPFIVDCLELRTNEKFGRHIITNQDLKPGDVIAIEESIFKMLGKSASFSNCTFCFKSNMLNLIPCISGNDESVCSFAMYCDQKCLSKARDRFHAGFCRSIDTLLSGCDDNSFITITSTWKGLLESLFVVQDNPHILQALMNSNKQTTIFDYDLSDHDDDPAVDIKYLSILNNLEARADENIETERKEISAEFVTFSGLRQLNHESGGVFVDYSTRLAMIKDRNSIRFSAGGQIVGQVVLPLASLYSHSCDIASISIMLIDGKFVHTVQKSIKKGEQLLINYGQDFNFKTSTRSANRDFHLRFGFTNIPDRVARQEAIMKSYNFECSCEACLKNYSVMTLPRYDPTFVKPAEKLPDTIESTITELRKHYKYIKDNFKNYPSLELLYSSMRCGQLVDSIEKKSMWQF